VSGCLLAITLGACTGYEPDKVAQSAGDRARWDDERARPLVGKSVIIGLTYEGSDGKSLRQEQLHGRIDFAHPTQGFCVTLDGHKLGMVYWMPPDVRAFHAARPGQYRLRSTGEVVVDPDLTANWIVTAQPAPSPSIELQKVRTGSCPKPER
jgi:hypothetical protein